jgi:hypothetical protein
MSVFIALDQRSPFSFQSSRENVSGTSLVSRSYRSAAHLRRTHENVVRFPRDANPGPADRQPNWRRGLHFRQIGACGLGGSRFQAASASCRPAPPSAKRSDRCSQTRRLWNVWVRVPLHQHDSETRCYGRSRPVAEQSAANATSNAYVRLYPCEGPADFQPR